MTSPDGITWTTQTSAADNNWSSVVWGGPIGQQKFVAVASTGTGNRVMTSPDGITWTTQTSAADNEWSQVAWGGPTGQQKFVAVANSGTGNRVMTSGLSASAPSAPTINSITSGDSSLTVSFTAAADGGSPITNYKYSTDGVTYSALNPATTTSPLTISGLTNGKTYSVSIKAVNGLGDSVASNAVVGTPVAPTTTAAPATTTTAAPTTTVTTTTVTTTTVTTIMTTSEKKVIKTNSELPKTGSNSSPLITLATILLSAGLVIVTRRRITS